MNSVPGTVKDFISPLLRSRMEKVTASVLQRNQVTLQYLLKLGWRLDQVEGAQVKSNADGTLLDLCPVSWTREDYRAFRLTGAGRRILQRLAAERAVPRGSRPATDA